MINIKLQLLFLGLGFSSSMPEAVIREKMAKEHAMAKQQREKDAKSNSDWCGQSNAFDSLLPLQNGKEAAEVKDGLSCLLTSQGLGKYIPIFIR